MGVIINYMGNYALKQVKFGAPLLSSMSIFTVSGWTEAHEKRSPIWGVWNAQQPQVYDLTGTRGSFWPAIFSQFMWFVSTYMALFTMFRLHHKVSLRLNCVSFNGQNKLLFCFYAAGMSWSALEACMGEFWKHNKMLHPSLIRLFLFRLVYVLLVPGWWLTPGFTCNIIQQARCSSLECCKFHNPIFQKWLSYTVTLTLSKLNKIESLERNVILSATYFR